MEICLHKKCIECFEMLAHDNDEVWCYPVCLKNHSGGILAKMQKISDASDVVCAYLLELLGNPCCAIFTDSKFCLCYFFCILQLCILCFRGVLL